jgi:hypothetical protein
MTAIGIRRALRAGARSDAAWWIQTRSDPLISILAPGKKTSPPTLVPTGLLLGAPELCALPLLLALPLELELPLELARHSRRRS